MKREASQILQCLDCVVQTVQFGFDLLNLLGVRRSDLHRNFGLVAVQFH